MRLLFLPFSQKNVISLAASPFTLETAPVASNVSTMLPTASSTDETMALRTTCSKWWKKKIYEMQLSGFDLEIKLAFA